MQKLRISFLCIIFLLSSTISITAQLSPDFYSHTCPNAATTVSSTIKTLSASSNVVSPSTLRLFAHDCFVQGCDASILISSTSDNVAERDAPDNKNLPTNAFDAIAKAKQAVEAQCPGVVSCADILALAARDAVVLLGGPFWEVPLGRRDGLVSKAALVQGHLPSANLNVPQLAASFASFGLSTEDLVVLSGAHTVGFSHCDQFTSRLYHFNSTMPTDPSLDPAFAKTLTEKCPQGGTGNAFQAFDIVSPFKFDNQFYINLEAGKGLLFSDQALFQDPSTRSTVESLAASQDLFFKNFVNAMIKMSLIGVKTGTAGEVRKDCTAFNPMNSNNGPPLNNPSPNKPISNPSPFTNPPSRSFSPPNPAVNAPNRPISNPSPFTNPPSTSFSPPNPAVNAPNRPISNPSPQIPQSPPSTPSTPSDEPPDSPSGPRFPRFPFHFPKFPGFPHFPKFRFPGFPGNGGSPGSQSQDVGSSPARDEGSASSDIED